MSVILVVLIILLLFGGIGALPRWPYSTGWGYGPASLLGAILLVVLIFALLGRV